MIKKAFYSVISNEYLKDYIFTHAPALLNEVIDIYKSKENKTVLDLTFGYGGHSKAILKCNPYTLHIGIDRDEVAYQNALELKSIYPQFIAEHAKFSDLDGICHKYNIAEKSVDFILMDLGASSMQMDNGQRGFSLSKNAKLDMKMNQNSEEISAFHVINYLNSFELSNIFKKYGDERHSRKIADAIVEYRSMIGPISTTHQLAELVVRCVGRSRNSDALGRSAHPATLIFQAIRIFVNDELNELCSALTISKRYLKPSSGRCVVISFHSLEDRLVKYAFHGKDFNGIDESFSNLLARENDDEQKMYYWKQCGDVITPSNDEIKLNPRIRSAKLRIVNC